MTAAEQPSRLLIEAALTLSRVVEVVDAWRRFALRLLVRQPALRQIFIRRELRIPVTEALCVAIAGSIALGCPRLAVWLGPALFGVPHITSGIRYVTVQRRLAWLTKACVAPTVVLGVLLLMQLTSRTSLVIGLFALLLALVMAIEVLASHAAIVSKAVLLAGLTLGAASALRWPMFFGMIVIHLHTLNSLSFFSTLTRRRQIQVWPLWVLTLLVVGATLMGGLDGLLARSLGPDALGGVLGQPDGSTSPNMVARVTFLYLFGQSLHYMVWLRLIPEVERPTPVPPSFRLALVHLRRDFGRWTLPVLALCAALVVAMLLGGRAARQAYSLLNFFHIELEAAGWLRLHLTAARPKLQPRLEKLSHAALEV